MGRRAAVGGIGALGLAFAIWSGCHGSSTGSAAGAAGGTAGQPVDGEAGAMPDAGASGTSGDATTDAGPPYPGAQACPWPGWYASPALPKGCFSACIPDDVTARVPALKWIDRSDWCPGCQWLEPSWWPGATPQSASATSSVVDGFGSGPDLVELGLRNPDKSVTVAMYDSSGNPVAGVRTQYTSCTTFVATMIGEDGTTAMRYQSLSSNQRWMLRPPDRAGELMLATKPTFAYSDAFVGQQTPNRSSVTKDWIVDAFGGNFMSLVDVKAGTAQKMADLPGAPPGEYDSAVISGSAVFVQAFTDKSSWFVVQNGTAKPFLGSASVDIERLVTDGKWIIWSEGTQLVPDPVDPTRMVAQRHDLYRAPFTADASKLQRQLLLPDTPLLYGSPTLANGVFTAIFYTDQDSSAAVHSDALVVKVDTGRAWKSDLPQDYVWGDRNYPTATKLWGPIAPHVVASDKAYTIARVPYADMTQIQAALP